MKLSRTAACGVHATLYLARHAERRVLGEEVAANLRMFESTMLRTLVALSRARILKSIKGPKGGYVLARDPSQITLLEIIEAADGPVRGDVGCVNPKVAGVSSGLTRVVEEAAQSLREWLAGVSVSDLMDIKDRDAR